jgi:hypothetical protein
VTQVVLAGVNAFARSGYQWCIGHDADFTLLGVALPDSILEIRISAADWRGPFDIFFCGDTESKSARQVIKVFASSLALEILFDDEDELPFFGTA